MSLQSRGSGTQFNKPAGQLPAIMRQPEIAQLWIALGGDPKKADEASAVAMAESSGNTKSVSNPCCKGLWQINIEVHGVSLGQALDPVFATRWTIQHSGNGTNWTPWEAQTNGAYRQYLGKSGIGSDGGGGGIGDIAGDVFGVTPLGFAINKADDVVGAVDDATDFLTELAQTLLDFRKLGQLAAEAVAWFIRLLAKAIWSYVIAPLWHWSERAVTWYWKNFFTVGTERGSGVGFVLRQNAGIITIIFWGIGYAVLWSDGESLSPASAQSSMLGRGIRGIEGTIARRNLTKPRDVKKATPTKPKAKASSASIARVKELGTERSRPVKVTDTAKGSTNERGNNRRQTQRVPRPGTAPESQRSAGASAEKQIFRAKQIAIKQAPAKRGAGMDSRVDSRDRIKSRTGHRGAKRS